VTEVISGEEWKKFNRCNAKSLRKHAKICLGLNRYVRHGYCSKPSNRSRRNLNRRADIVPNEKFSPLFSSGSLLPPRGGFLSGAFAAARNFIHLSTAVLAPIFEMMPSLSAGADLITWE
jgi:hypothetical protein